MDVVRVSGIRARSEHGGEARAGRFPHRHGKSHRSRRTGECDAVAVLQLDAADVERIALGVFGDLRARHMVAGAAIVGVRRAQRSDARPERVGRGAHVRAHPLGHRLSHRAGERRAGRDLHAVAVGHHDFIQEDEIDGAARARSVPVRQPGKACDLGKANGTFARRRRGRGTCLQDRRFGRRQRYRFRQR